MSVLTNTLLTTGFSNMEHCSDWGEEFTHAQVYFPQVSNQSLGNKAWSIFWEESKEKSETARVFQVMASVY